MNTNPTHSLFFMGFLIALCTHICFALAQPNLLRIPLEQVSVPLKYSHKIFKAENLTYHQLWHELDLDNQADMVYVGKIRAGQDEVPFRVLFDTGSSQVWLVSSACHSKFCHGKSKYEIKDELDEPEEHSIHYSAGKLSGYTVTDILRMKSLVLFKQPFLAAKTVHISKYYMFDGIIGMNPSKLQHHLHQNTFLQNLKIQNQLERAVFSFVLYEYEDLDHRYDSYMIFGGIDYSLFYGSLSWHLNHDHTFWSLQVEKVGFGGALGKAQGKAVIDSGTSYILCPKKLILGFFEKISAKQTFGIFWSVRCDSSLPVFKIVLDGGFEIVLHPSDYTHIIDEVCYLSLLPLESDNDNHSRYNWILGAAFLRAYHVVFDMDYSRIGIARFKNTNK